MKLKETVIVFIFILFFFASCEKEKDIPVSGELISFKAGTDVNDHPSTKTEYSGAFYNEEGTEFSYSVAGYTERIDWVENTDIIRVFSPEAVKSGTSQHWADYRITSVSIDNKSSNATVEAVGGSMDGLIWGMEDNNDFYAMYPAPGTKWQYNLGQVVSSTDAMIEAEGTGIVISGVIPASQAFSKMGNNLRPNMNSAYMYAVNTGVSRGVDVDLEFSPLVTVITFSLMMDPNNRLANNTKMNSIKLSSSQTGSFLAGKFSIPVTEDGVGTPVITDGSNEISLPLPQTGYTLSYSEDKIYTFTFFTLPTDQTNLTLTIGFTDGTSRSLDLKNNGEWIVAKAHKKLFVNNLGLTGDYFYTITIGSRAETSSGDYRLASRSGNSSVSLTSYKSRDLAQTRIPVEWEIEGFYFDEACTEPVSEEDVWVHEVTPSDNFAGTDERDLRSSSVKFKYAFNNHNIQYLNQAMISNNAVATSTFGQGSYEGNYYNLSNPQNMSSSNIEETANCYIVNGAGYYRIPLVIGNGIVDGVVNPNPRSYQGWEGKKSTETFQSYYGEYLKDAEDAPVVVTTPFYDYKQQVPQSVYLHKTSSAAGIPTSAFVVWEDVESMIEVADADYTLPSSAISKEGDIYWLNFHVASQIQGNAVIAVADGNGTVMWSWHIWETDYVPFNYPGTKPDPDKMLNDDDNVMPRHLGFIYADYQSDQREIYVKVIQKELGETGEYKTKVSRIVQKGNKVEHIGRNPFFAWGRKDAFWPGDAEIEGEWSNRPAYYGRYARTESYSSVWETEHQSGVKTGFLIQNPGNWRTRFNYFSRGYQELEYYNDAKPNPDPATGKVEPRQAGQVYAYNLWDAENYDRDVIRSRNYNNHVPPVEKTIYDPCPAGYHVPGYNAFSGLTNGENGYSVSAVDNCITVNGINFHLTGFEHFSSAYVKWNNETLRLWLAAPARLLDKNDPTNPNNDNDNYDGASLVVFSKPSITAIESPKDLFFYGAWHRGAGCSIRPVTDRNP